MKKSVNNLVSMWKLCFHTSPKFMLYVLYNGFRQQFLIFLEHTVAIRYVLHCAEYGEPFYKAVIVVGAVLLLYMIAMIPDGYYVHKMQLETMPKLYQALKNKIYEKAADIDLKCYDNPHFYNEFVLSVSESKKSIDDFLQLINVFVQSITLVLTTGLFFLATDAIGIIFVVISFLLSLLFAQKTNVVDYKLKHRIIPWERKREYTKRIFYLNDYAKELRLYPQLGNFILKDFLFSNEQITKEKKRIAKTRTSLLFAQSYLAGSFILDGLYIIYLIFQAVIFHNIDYSSTVVLFNRTGGLKRGLNMFVEAIQTAGANSLYIEKIKKFLSYTPEIKHEIGIDVPNNHGELEIRNISFKYSQDSEEILHNISLKVKSGEKIAIVGYNGAGKTTLIKLIMRLYDPTSGEILYNGKNIKEYNLDNYHKCFGVIFQDYKMYGATLLDNVILDDVQNTDYVEKEATDALENSGFTKKLQSLPKGIYTSITTEFDENGIELSGGESQKVAIAREKKKKANILIMDEPSSALDPIAEYNLNKSMQNIAANKMVFYISHRLSTTRDADRIIMLDHGKIVESGTHDDLIAKNGLYKEMFELQAEGYN